MGVGAEIKQLKESPDKQMEYLFSYGTLRHEAVQNDLFGRRLTGHPDQLPGYRIEDITIEDEGFTGDQHQKIAVHTDNAKDMVEGEVFEVTEQELLVADKYEPMEYKRIMVKLESGKEAWIYASI